MDKLSYTEVKKLGKPLKILLHSPTWGGKTMGSLLLATGIVMAKRGYADVKDAWQHILLVDSEYRRGTMYAAMGPYKYLEVTAPYNTEKIDNILKIVETDATIDVVIFDSMTHYWAKDGGILSEKTAKDKLGGNSYTNWLEYTGKFNRTVDAILGSSKHIIATARSKSDTVLIPNEQGKMAPKTFGLKPELRDDSDFEFDIVFNIDKETHNLIVEKALPGMNLFYPPISSSLGAEIYNHSIDGALPYERSDEAIKASITAMAREYDLVQWFQIKNNGVKLAAMTHDMLVNAEIELIKHIRTLQVKPSGK